MRNQIKSNFKSRKNLADRSCFDGVAIGQKESWKIFRFSLVFGSIIGIQIQGKNLPRNKDGTLVSVEARGFDE